MSGCALIAECPHALKIVETANFRTKHVDDNIACIDQHPVGCRESFDADMPKTAVLDPLGELLGHCRNLSG